MCFFSATVHLISPRKPLSLSLFLFSFWHEFLDTFLHFRKNLAPAIYYISSPLLAMLMVILLCGFIAHVVIPLGHRYGLAFNNVAQAAQQKSKAVEKLKMAMEGHLLDYGLTWKDVEEKHVSVSYVWLCWGLIVFVPFCLLLVLVGWKKALDLGAQLSFLSEVTCGKAVFNRKGGDSPTAFSPKCLPCCCLGDARTAGGLPNLGGSF